MDGIEMELRPLGKLRMLVVDDDPSVREALREYFQREGFSVLLARDGEEAIQRLRRDPVNVSVMDVHMPGMSGPEVLQTLRAEPDVRFIPPTVLVSSDASAAEFARALRGVPIGFVPKPIRLSSLKSSMWQVMLQTCLTPQPGLPSPLRTSSH